MENLRYDNILSGVLGSNDEATHSYCIDHDTLISGLTLLYGENEIREVRS